MEKIFSFWKKRYVEVEQHDDEQIIDFNFQNKYSLKKWGHVLYIVCLQVVLL